MKQSENIEAEFIQVPSLLLQPYVENAVWHGLRHKEGEKKITITITENKQQLIIVIEDNGIGREKSNQIKMQKIAAEQFESKGTELAKQRIALLNQQYNNMAKTETLDKKDADGNVIGTQVIISLPIYSKNN
jgi:LytS/YehU family sensor histidine kinase